MGRDSCAVAFAAVLAVLPLAAAKVSTKASRAFLAPGRDIGLDSVDEACGSIGDQLGEIKDQTNGTLNVLSEQVYDGTQGAIDSLNMFKDAAADQEGTEDSAEMIGDKVTALVVNMQGSVSSKQDKIVGDVGKQSDAFSDLSKMAVDSFAAAGEKVDACNSAGAPTFARRTNDTFWPFSWGKKKDVFEKAEDAIIKANKTVIKIVAAIEKINATSIEAMTSTVLSSLEAVNAQFQEKCEIVVTSQSDTLPDILATQASNVCTATDSMMDGLSSTVYDYVQFVGEKITAAQNSAQVLFTFADTLMSTVQDARDAADGAASLAEGVTTTAE